MEQTLVTSVLPQRMIWRTQEGPQYLAHCTCRHASDVSTLQHDNLIDSCLHDRAIHNYCTLVLSKSSRCSQARSDAMARLHSGLLWPCVAFCVVASNGIAYGRQQDCLVEAKLREDAEGFPQPSANAGSASYRLSRQVSHNPTIPASECTSSHQITKSRQCR